MVARNDPEEIKKGPNDVRRFMKRTAKTKTGEEAVVKYVIDEETKLSKLELDCVHYRPKDLNSKIKKIL